MTIQNCVDPVIEEITVDDFLTTEEVAERLDVSPRTVLNYIQREYFPNARKKNPLAERRSEWLIPETDIEDFEKLRDESTVISKGLPQDGTHKMPELQATSIKQE